MNDTFLMASTSYITVQSLAKIVLSAPAVGAKTWCLCVFFVCHRQVRRSGNRSVLFLLSSQKSKFCPLAENYELDRKMVDT